MDLHGWIIGTLVAGIVQIAVGLMLKLRQDMIRLRKDKSEL